MKQTLKNYLIRITLMALVLQALGWTLPFQSSPAETQTATVASTGAVVVHSGAGYNSELNVTSSNDSSFCNFSTSDLVLQGSALSGKACLLSTPSKLTVQPAPIYTAGKPSVLAVNPVWQGITVAVIDYQDRLPAPLARNNNYWSEDSAKLILSSSVLSIISYSAPVSKLSSVQPGQALQELNINHWHDHNLILRC